MGIADITALGAAEQRGYSRGWRMAVAWGALVVSLIVPQGEARAQASVIDDPGAPPILPWDDDNGDTYRETIVASGDGWRLVESSGLDEFSGRAFTERLFMIDDATGVANAPLPEPLRQSLIEDLANVPEDERTSFTVSQRVVDAVNASLAQGAATPELIALAEFDDELPIDTVTKRRMLKGCGDRDIDKSKHFSIAAPLTNTRQFNDNFSGSLSLTGTANVDADGSISIKLKRTRILFFCVPYGVRFNHARVWGTALVDQGATLSGTIAYSNSQAREWQIAKPHLFSIDFMAGPIPVHIGFNLPITAGFDEHAINASVTGQVTYSGRRTLSGYIDYTCTSGGCSGAQSFNTTNLGSQVLTASVSGRFQPSIYAQVALRAYLYGEGFAYVQVGVRPYLHGDLWGYYGNNCGDADGDGYFETVKALTFDLDWHLAITAQADTFLTSTWRRTLWSSPRWHINYWDLLGGEGSTALTPMLQGPAQVPVATTQTYGARMRPCWPYADNVDYAVNWGDGATGAVTGAPATPAVLTHAWSSVGDYQPVLTAINDAHGRDLRRATARHVLVDGRQGHKGMTWKLLERNGSYAHVGTDAQTNPYVGDTEPSASLPILCLRQDGRPAPLGIAFDFYNGWAAGEVATSAPVQGLLLTSRAVADARCAADLGAGFRMAEFHDGGGGWSWWGQGVLSPATRFWVAINDQPANPWN